MIIRRDGDAHLFITQPDHAALAERVMRHSVELQRHPRAKSILLAIGEHDNGWAEADAAPGVDPQSGEPLDFVHAPAAVRQGVWPRGVERLAPDLWAAALVAHHAAAVYDRYRGEPEWTEFFPRMEALRDALVAQARGALPELLADYRFVRLGDLVSLMFCAGWDEPQHFHRWTVARDGDRVTVLPSPFDSANVEMTVAAKRVPVARFESDEALRAALAAAPIVTLRGTAGAPAPLDEAATRAELERVKQEIGRYHGEREAVDAEFERFVSSFRPGAPAPSPPPPAVARTVTDDAFRLDEVFAAAPDPSPLPPVVTSAPAPAPPRRRSSPAPWLFAVLLIALVLAGYVTWVAMTPPPVPDAFVTPSPAPAPPAAEPPAPEPTPPPAAATPSPFESVVTTTSAVWVRVVADGETIIAREVPADASVPFTARETIVIRTGNAGALRLTIGGVDQGVLGRPGQVITRRFDVPR